jgi:hypothetical protein
LYILLNNFNNEVQMPSDTTNTVVIAIQGNSISPTAPTTNQILEWDGSEWVPTDLPSTLPPSGSAGGDLGGSYPNPDVINIYGASVPAAGALTPGNVLQVSGSSVLTYAPINLAGGSDYVSGVLPTGNQAAQSMGGDVSGTTASATVTKLQGRNVANTVPTDGYVLTYVASNTDWEPQPIPIGMTGLRKDIFTSNGTWTCPAGVTSVLIIGYGAGGGGGGGGGTFGGGGALYGGGGGAGALQNSIYAIVVPGTMYSVNIGSGGAGGSSHADGSPGGNTTFGSLAVFSGSSGGLAGSNGGNPGLCFKKGASANITGTAFTPASGGNGGGGANGNVGNMNVIGGFSAGTGGSVISSAGGGGGGGSGPSATGSNGGNGSATTGNNGSSASSNTGSGGGGAGGGPTAGGIGGNGGSGKLWIVY